MGLIINNIFTQEDWPPTRFVAAGEMGAMVGGTLAFFTLFASAQAGSVVAGELRMPIVVSFPFLAVLLAMGYVLSRDTLRVAQLRESEQRISVSVLPPHAVPPMCPSATLQMLAVWQTANNKIPSCDPKNSTLKNQVPNNRNHTPLVILMQLHGNRDDNFPLQDRGEAALVPLFMRFFLTLLTAFGVFAGPILLVLASCESCVASETTGHRCTNVPNASQRNGQNQGSEKCPVDHHHTSCCSHHVMPLSLAEKSGDRFGNPGSFLPRNRHESEIPPDSPFLGSEKPPLI